MKYIFFLLLLTSCSAEWHIRRAIKKNPALLDTTENVQLVVIRDTIHDTIITPAKDFGFTLDSLSHLLGDFSLLYHDSFVKVYGKMDSLGRLKIKGEIPAQKVPVTVYINKPYPVKVKCPPSYTIEEGYPKWYFWVLCLIFVILFVIRK